MLVDSLYTYQEDILLYNQILELDNLYLYIHIMEFYLVIRVILKKQIIIIILGIYSPVKFINYEIINIYYLEH